MLFLRDGVKLCDGFTNKLELYMKSEFDIMLFDNECDATKINFDDYYGYLISKNGMDKVINYVKKNKIKSINYLDGLIDMKICKISKMYEYENIVNYDYVDTNTLYKKLDGYKFYSLMDSYGHDINYVGNKPIDEIKAECEKLNGIAFNTLGWIKNVVTPEEQFINLPGCTNTFDGFYVKI
jgi:hypothetical protein